MLLGFLPSVAAAAVPTGQTELNEWWSASKRMWIGEDAYEADGSEFDDGQCSAKLNDGIIIPVYTGVAPLSERVVGVLFIGKGELTVGMDRRSDRWGFANHLVMTGEKEAAEVEGIASGASPYTVGITRAMILSADPAVEQMLMNRMPVGPGVYRTEAEEGVNEEYVVTASRGKARAQLIGTNMLPQRTLRLEQAGLDVVAMLRQDRLMHEELGFATGQLRRVADFRTEDRFHVAAHEGTGLGPAGYDQWLTCFKDPLGQSDVGEQNMVFAHGEDGEGDRHFQRMAGTGFAQGPDDLVPRPQVMMEAVDADSKVEIKPVNRRNYMSVEVESLLTLRARGAAIQHVALGMPTEGSDPKDLELISIETVDGDALAHVGLHADTAFFVRGSANAAGDAEASVMVDEGTDAQDMTQTEAPSVDANRVSIGGGGGPASAQGMSTGSESSASSSEDLLGTPLEMQTVSGENSDFDLFTITAFKSEVLVLLPEPIQPGETTQIRVKWKSRWLNNNRTFSGRYMGSTTGAKRFLPELLPSPGGTAWNAVTEFTLPPSRFFPLEGSISGETLSDVEGDDGWRTIKAHEPNARIASVGVGKWAVYSEPATKRMPSIRVNLDSTQARVLGEFPPEIRRVVSFLQRFLPQLESNEIEVYQGPSMLPSTAMSSEFRYGRSGLVQLRRIKTTDVGANTDIQKKYPALTQSMLARQVAHQYWGQRTPANSARDAWLVDALADSYGSFYVRAALGKEPWKKRIDAVTKRIEQPVIRGGKDDVKKLRRPLSLSESGSLSDISGVTKADYGFLTLSQTLRERVGQTAFFLGLDRLAQRRANIPVTTDDLQAIMEETSGQDLADFFDFWVHGGRIPKVKVRYALVAGADETMTVEGCIESDVPFGSYDLPVSIEDGGGEVAALVDIDNGSGAFTVPGRTGEVTVKVDPKRQMLLYTRDVELSANAPECGG
jgi:hypothetical protein